MTASICREFLQPFAHFHLSVLVSAECAHDKLSTILSATSPVSFPFKVVRPTLLGYTPQEPALTAKTYPGARDEHQI